MLSRVAQSLVAILLLAQNIMSAVPFQYHNHEQLTTFLKDLAAKYPTKTYLYSIGKTVQNRDLWVMAIADSNPQKHVILRPEAKYIGNMHGNEVPSKEVLIQLLDYMLTSQTTDPDVDFIMKNTRVHIMPSMNPDGFEMSRVNDCSSVTGRYNANNRDLNRNFPDFFETNSEPIQPETTAVMNWLAANNFVLSANGHGGSLVVNYPFDNYRNSNGISKDNPSDDDDVFVVMSRNYSRNNPAMRAKADCTVGEPFTDGTVNGAEWYPVRGGMQDYNYWKVGCMEVTLEISCCKYPAASQLETIWNQNRKSMLDYLKFANTGVRGVVKFADGTIGANLTIKIDSREPAFKTNANGEYYRILLPGQYSLAVLMGCTNLITASITVPSTTGLLEYNITLDKSRVSDYTKAKLDRFAVFCSKSSVSYPRTDIVSQLSSASSSSTASFTSLFSSAFLFVAFSLTNQF